MADAPETFRSHLPALAGSLIGTLLSAIVGSHIGGALGTRYALIFGAFISGSASWWAERAIRRSQAVAKARYEARKRQGGRELTPTETQMIDAAAIRSFERKNRGIHYRTIALVALSALVVVFITIFVLDKLGARSVADIAPAPRPTVTRTEIITPNTATEPVTLSPTVTPDQTPTVVPSVTITPFSSVTASATPVPDSTPSDSPTDTTPTTGGTPWPTSTIP